MSIWEKTTLEKLGTLKRCSQYIKFSPYSFGKLVNFVSGRLIKGGLYVNSLEKYLDTDIKISPYPEGSICIKTNGINIYSSILRKPSYLFRTLADFEPFPNVCDSLFIKYCFDFSAIKKQWKELMTAKGKIHHTISTNLLKQVFFWHPPLAVQIKIGEIVSNYDLLSENFEKQINLLKIHAYSGPKDINHLIWFLQKKIEILGRIKMQLIEGIYSQTLEIN